MASTQTKHQQSACEHYLFWGGEVVVHALMSASCPLWVRSGPMQCSNRRQESNCPYCHLHLPPEGRTDITDTSVSFGSRKTTSVKQTLRGVSCGYSQRAAFFDPEGRFRTQ